MSLQTTASQTAGPYLHIGLAGLQNDNLAPEGVAGERITLQGRVFDGDGHPVPDGMVEIWQANAHGRYAHPADTRDLPLEKGFTGFGRMATDRNGGFRFYTVKPGRVPGPGGKPQAPHIVVSVFMRGLLRHLSTRVYFPDEAANAEDFVLSLVPAERRSTLIARAVAGQAGVLEWNIVLQGEANGQDETVFFDI